MAAQPIWVWPGMLLVGCRQSSKRDTVQNGMVYRLESFDEGTSLFKVMPQLDGDDIKPIELTREDFTACMRVRHALTYYAAQGQTYRSLSTLLVDTTNPNVTLKHLIVGTSRVTEGRYLAVASNERERELMKLALAAADRLERLIPCELCDALLEPDAPLHRRLALWRLARKWGEPLRADEVIRHAEDVRTAITARGDKRADEACAVLAEAVAQAINGPALPDILGRARPSVP